MKYPSAYDALEVISRNFPSNYREVIKIINVSNRGDVEIDNIGVMWFWGEENEFVNITIFDYRENPGVY